MTFVLIIISVIAYTLSILAFSQGARYLNSNILGGIINFLGTLVPIGLFVLYASQRYVVSGHKILGYVWALVGGIGIGVFTIVMTKLYSSGQNVSFISPLVYGGAVFLASAVGVVIYKEKLLLPQLVGMISIVIGILLISFATYRGSTQ